MRGAGVIFAALLVAACGGDIAFDANEAAPPAGDAAPREDPGNRPAFDASFDDAGAAVDAGDGGADATSVPTWPAPDPVFHARVMKHLGAELGDELTKHDWNALFRARVPWSGVMIWIPGTGGGTSDDATGRAMGSVPAGFAIDGPAITYAGTPSVGSWLGVSCSQSKAGARFLAIGNLSALEVFDTAWPDALAIVAALGPTLKGAWVVGHSAGANPAMLVGLLGGAARVDAYGLPSTVGPLDGDDGLVHLHTHPLDPAGSMGKIGASGHAEIDLLSAFVAAVKSGGMGNHDYAGWPAPSPK